jgi:hypothetical protein
MATIEKVRERISQISTQRKNTTPSDIEWVVRQLGQNGYDVRIRVTDHSTLYTVGDVTLNLYRRFNVCTHNRGSKQVKSCYVDEFLNAMVDLGLYE